MVKLNHEQRGMVQYFDIQSYMKRGKLVWIAWYYIKMDDNQILEALNDAEKL